MKEEGGGGGRGGQRGGLTDVSCPLQIPRRYRTLPWASKEGRTGTQPYQKPDQSRIRIQTRNQTRTEPEFKFSAKQRGSASNPQLRLRPFDQSPASRTRGQEKRRRKQKKGEGYEGLRRGKREGRVERSINSLVPYQLGHSGQLSASRDQGQKGTSCGHWVWSIRGQACS